jgi:hypothetical protein
MQVEVVDGKNNIVLSDAGQSISIQQGLQETDSDENDGKNRKRAGVSMGNGVENGINTVHGRRQIGAPGKWNEF